MATWREYLGQRTWNVKNNRRQLQDSAGRPEKKHGGDEEEAESLIERKSDEDARQSSIPLSVPSDLASTLLLLTSIVFYVLLYIRAPSDSACEKQNWAWSPMMDGLEFEWTQYDSDIIPDTYAGPPTEERRNAWKMLHEQGWIEFPDAKLPLLNKSVDERDWWRMPPPGRDKLVALPEVVHQAHCVGWLYLFAHRADWNYHTVEHMEKEIVFKLHANHCFLAIMRMITCNADVTPVLFQEDLPGGLGIWKTRDAPHKCKKWDVLGKWQEKHKICRTDCLPGDLVPGQNITQT